MAAKPPRKFAPVLVEETTKSTSRHVEVAEEPPKPRRFKPVLVEDSTKSSKDMSMRTAQADKPKPRKIAPEPVEHTVKSSKGADHETEVKPQPRRFAPQLIDESEKSSKIKDGNVTPTVSESKPKPRRFAPQLVDGDDEAPKPKARRFAPQLVGESEKSTKKRDARPHVKFKAEPIATTYGSNRRGKRSNAPSEASDPDQEAEEKPTPRKFAPILLDTATRSRRAGELNAPISEDYRTEYGYHAHQREHWRRVNGETSAASANDPEADGMDIDQQASSETSSMKLRAVCNPDGSRSSRSPLPKPQRQHSFRAPELETIESSESDGDTDGTSAPQTPNGHGSSLHISPSYELFKHATKRRESIDDSWQHYLLDLERKKAQERLEEQALAAFPNADFGYEHPHHYFNLDDDSGEFEIEDRPVTWDEGNDDDFLEMARRESTVNLMWEKGELQRHAEVLQQERNAMRTTAAKPSTQSPFQKLNAPRDDELDAEMRSMLDRAKPPMLGNDLVFVRCTSPEPARFDVTQGVAMLKNQMDYLTAKKVEREQSTEEQKLWQTKKRDSKRDTAPQTPITPTTPSTKGLWGGFCVDDGGSTSGFSGRATPSGITGLMTPRHELTNPFNSFPSSRPGGQLGASTPGRNKSRTDLQRLNAILVTEHEIDSMMEREYPDSFITQVYNYLSLGYPSLARPFDEELSKISRIPIPELRQDDQKARASPRGFIRLGSDFEGGGGEGLVEDNCMRWRALKRYVREWAKQEKNWSPSDGVGGIIGTGARRGSWGI